jgi:hypothetical protein
MYRGTSLWIWALIGGVAVCVWALVAAIGPLLLGLFIVGVFAFIVWVGFLELIVWVVFLELRDRWRRRARGEALPTRPDPELLPKWSAGWLTADASSYPVPLPPVVPPPMPKRRNGRTMKTTIAPTTSAHHGTRSIDLQMP